MTPQCFMSLTEASLWEMPNQNWPQWQSPWGPNASIELGKILTDMGFDIIATHGTAKALAKAGVSCRRVNKVREGRPHIVDMIKNGEIDLIVNTTEGKQAINESESIRAEAVRKAVTYYTTLGAAIATCRAIDHLDNVEVNRLQDLHNEVVA